MKKNSFIKWLVWILAALFYFYEFVLRVSPSVMVPELMLSFGITASSVGILSAFYLYAYAPMQLPVGILMDQFGIKKILTLASIVCGLGAILFSLAPDLSIASLGRLLIGGSSAFAFIAMVYISSHWFSLKKRAFLIGIANSIAMLGASAGTGPLATLIQHIGWRDTIKILGVFGILLGMTLYLVLQKDPHTPQVERETSHKKTSTFDILKQVTSKKNNWINALTALLFYITTTAFAGLWGLSFVQTAYGVTKEVAGYAMSMIFAGWLVGGPLMGFFSDRIGKRKIPLRIGILGALLCLVLVIYLPSISIYVAYVLLFFIGLFSSAELLCFTLAIELNTVRTKATAAAFVNFLVSCGDALVQPFIGLLLDAHWDGKLQGAIPIYSTKDYQAALLCLPVALAMAFLLLFFIREKNDSLRSHGKK